MKALIYYGPKNIKLEEIEKPAAASTDVIVKVKRAGICGSDLTAYLLDGMKVGIPMKGQFGHDGQFGHEMAGVVETVGADVKDVNVGDRVFINPTACKRNGMMGCDVAGAFSEYVLVEDAAYGKNLLQLSDDVSFDEAVVIEPLAVGTHGKNCINVKPHEKVVIFGAGTIGLCTLNAVLAVGCKEPVVVEMNEQRLDLAKKMGGTPFSPKNGDLKGFLEGHFGYVSNPFGMKKADVDAFIDCAGATPIVGQVIEAAKEHARLSIVAVYKKSIDFNIADMMSGQMTIQGSCGYEESDVIEAFQNINGKRTCTPEIVTHHFSIDEAVEAFEFAANPKSGAVKVVIDYE